MAGNADELLIGRIKEKEGGTERKPEEMQAKPIASPVTTIENFSFVQTVMADYI